MGLQEVRDKVRRRRLDRIDAKERVKKMYKCISCKKTIAKIDEKIRCPYCGFRIYAKMRPEVVRRVVAR